MPNVATARPPRVTKWSRHLDTNRRYLTDDPTPAKIAGYLRDVDNGDVGAMLEMDQEMRAKDSHLQGVASRRREAVTALDWEIVPDTATEDTDGSRETADYCQRHLAGVQTFEDTLLHLQEGVPPGIAAVELVWHRGELAETIDVAGHRLMSDPYVGPGFRIETDEEMVDGVPIAGSGFILFTPNASAGFPLHVTMTRAGAWLWVLKHFAIADWSGFAEQFGSPWRMATLASTANDDQISKVEDMLAQMSADTYGVFSEGVDVKFLEAARNSQPYEGMVDWIEAKQAVLYLGQTLTTEQGSVGSLALGQVHENVRASITLSDIKNEARVIREQVLRYMVRFHFPNRNLPIPHFKRVIADDVNVDVQRLKMEQIRMATELQLPIDKDFLYDGLNIERPKGDEGVN